MRDKFYQWNSKIYKVLLEEQEDIWMIDYLFPKSPFQVARSLLQNMTPWEPKLQPSIIYHSPKAIQTKEKKLTMLQPLLKEKACIYDSGLRKELANQIAIQGGYTPRRIIELYYKALAQGEDALYSKTRNKRKSSHERNIKWAINKYYYSSRQATLKQAYTLMLAEKYADPQIACPTYNQFYYYYHLHMRNSVKKEISRNGITHYQQNHRPLYGRAEQDINMIGAYQMDATDADIYLVSKFNRAQPIGRPKIYLAVDTLSHLIAGVYVGLEGGENAVMECLKQAASDKVEYCAQYGITISPEEWPSHGVPNRIITDKGTEFVGKRMDELCRYFGITREAMPPYRPDKKGIVERSFYSLQENYKYLLRHRGVIEENCQERGVPSHVKEATLNLREFTAIVIYSILKINNTAVLKSLERNEEMAQDNVAPVAAKVWQWYEKHQQSGLISASEEEVNTVMLPMGKGKFTRRGLLFRGIYYCRDGYHTRCANAGINGAETVKVAYDCLCTDYVYLVENGEYIRFELTPSKERYLGGCYSDVELYLKKERENKRKFQQIELEESAKYARQIQEIARAASKEKEGLIETAQVKQLKQNRTKEKGDKVF